MPHPKIPAAVIAQRGRDVTLVDESTVTLVYTFSSLMTIEDDFGTLATAFARLDLGERGNMMSTCAQLMAAGLQHEPATDDRGPLSDVDTLAGLLDTKRIHEYAEKVGDALAAAFPDAADEGGDSEADPTKDSRGESGTTSQPSPSDAPTPSSGA